MGIRQIISVSGIVAIVASSAFAVVSQTSPALADSGCPTGVAASLVSGVYEIDTAAKLQWLKETGVKSNSYKLTANINMSGCTWTNGIGTNATPFSGTFDGNSKTISNLTLSGTNYLGLFGYVSGIVSDLTLASPSITATSQMIGALAGEVKTGGSVSNITVTNVTATAPSQFVGGAIGYVRANSTVSNVIVSGNVSSPGGVAGGVAAAVEGTMTNVSSNATVSGSFNIGGLAGSLYSAGLITNSSASATVSATSSSAGGAVGSLSGTITAVTTSGTVDAPMYAGGLAGYADTYVVLRSSSSATVTATGSHAGGLVAYDNFPGEIRGSYFTGQVQAADSVGGIGGLLRSVIADSYSRGSVTATSATNGGRAGGLVGWLRNVGVTGYPDASITNSFASGLVTPPSGSSSTVGGLVGNYASGTITNSVWDINSTGRSTSGGTGAKGYSTQQLRDYVLYDSDNLNWNITDGISSGNGVTTGTTWSICSGASGGYPFLTRQGLSGTCLPTMAYNGNGSTGGTAPSDGTTPYTSGSTVSVVGNTGALTKTGSVFAGWNTKANGTGTPYAAGDSFTITAPVMLFAQWTTTPTVTYQSNGGTGFIGSQTGASGSSITLSSGTGFSRTGFQLSRWDTSAFGTGVSYSLSQSITMPVGGLTLWAVWTATSSSSSSSTTSTSTTSTTTPSNTSSTTTPPSASTTPTPSSDTGQSSSGGQTTQTTVAKSQPSQSSSSSTTTTTAAPSSSTTTTTTSTVPQQSDVPDVEGVGDSEAGATVGGKPVATSVTDENGSIVVSIGEASVRYTVLDSAGIRRSLGASSATEVQPGDTVTIELKGFAEEAEATAWLVPGDVSLGSATLKNGSGMITGTVPADASSGVRRLVTATQSADNEPIVVAYGVEVSNASDSGPSWSLVFLIFLGFAAGGALIIPAARRRRDDED